ncbi:hypothetical protein FOC4_g10000743, partial [Fusarium odoratissimum]
LKHFNWCITKGLKNYYYLLILNSSKSPYLVNFKRYYKANKIILLYMPPYLSYLL